MRDCKQCNSCYTEKKNNILRYHKHYEGGVDVASDNTSWKLFFNQIAPTYLEYGFTKNTIAEVDFIEEELKLPKGSRILDVGCGIGRHSLELARRGYLVTGLDLSAGMLAEAKRHCAKEGLVVEFIHADATDFTIDKTFDACICLCEGAFGLLSLDEDPFERDEKILRNIYAVLKHGAPFFLTALNGLKMIRKYNEGDIESGRFDPLAITVTSPLSELIDSAPSDMFVREKGFLATELRQMLKHTGFNVDNIWGGTAGSWHRERLKLDEMELMVISKKH